MPAVRSQSKQHTLMLLIPAVSICACWRWCCMQERPWLTFYLRAPCAST